MFATRLAVFAFLGFGCGSQGPGPDPDAPGDAPDPTGCTTPTECASVAEQQTSDRFDSLISQPDMLASFLKAMPKGGDLHNHLNGSVYAETMLEWAKEDGGCINSTSFAAVSPCSGGTQPVPTSGTFYDQIVRAWSMKDFVPGAETGRDHFFSTFGKFGSVSGLHRNDSIVDVLVRAAEENQLYVETMFNLGRNVGTLSGQLSTGTLTAANLPALYDQIIADPGFAAAVTNDTNVVLAASDYRETLGCDEMGASPACGVDVRFIAPVSRTGAPDQIFGQLVSAYEMASRSEMIVGANLSSPEDDPTSLANYNLHMAMLDFLHGKYASVSPLHITLHAGEVTPEFLPPGSNHNTFHIRSAVEIGHAERIGHGLDILSETNSDQLLATMRDRNVMVEVCLSSNIQILEVSGSAHPLAKYLEAGVPVALATDDQGVSRSSMAGEYLRGALDQQLDYRQLKTISRTSLEHAFLEGPSLWSSIRETQPVSECAASATAAVGGLPSAACRQFLDSSERARLQWELEARFLSFERLQ